MRRSLSPIALLLLAAIFAFSSCEIADNEQSIHPLVELEGERGTWNWVDVEGMTCRDGSATGVGVRLGTKKTKWVFYLQGGGACFTESTCADNRASYAENDFTGSINNGFYDVGMLNNNRDENPVKDWNFVFVPYCTGDVHSGSNEKSYGLGLSEPQKFVGADNIVLLLDFLRPYMDDNAVDEIMITGVSAGGFGTHISYFTIKERWPQVKTHLVNDSGPLMSDPDILPVCFQLGLQFIYDLPVPPGFIFCCQPAYGLADIYTLAARQYPEDNFCLLSFKEDATIRFFLAAGQNTCTGGEVSGPAFESALIRLKEDVFLPGGKWSTFYMNGAGHTVIQNDNNYYGLEVEGTKVYEFIGKVMDGEVLNLE